MSVPKISDDLLQGHVDRKLLSAYAQLLGADAFAMIVAEVEKDMGLYREEISLLQGTFDGIPIRKLLHRLDGFAKQFGFEFLARLSSNGLQMQGAQSEAVLAGCDEELAFLSDHRYLIF